MNPLPWAKCNDKTTKSYTIGALSQSDLSFPLIAFLLLILICLLLIFLSCSASNDFAWEEEKFIQYLEHPLKEELEKKNSVN